MPPRSPWMKRRIFGFQRRVWWPKWTPASSSSLRPISAMVETLLVVVVQPGKRGRGPGALCAGQEPLPQVELLGAHARGRELIAEQFNERFCGRLRFGVLTGRAGSPTPNGRLVRLTLAGGP